MNQQVDNDQPAAVLPRRSRRLATIIPASHWVGLGYSEDDAYMMEKLQNDMKRYAEGEFGSDETIVDFQGKIEGMVPHHELMIPHWKKLIKALNITAPWNTYLSRSVEFVCPYQC